MAQTRSQAKCASPNNSKPQKSTRSTTNTSSCKIQKKELPRRSTRQSQKRLEILHEIAQDQKDQEQIETSNEDNISLPQDKIAPRNPEHDPGSRQSSTERSDNTSEPSSPPPSERAKGLPTPPSERTAGLPPLTSFSDTCAYELQLLLKMEAEAEDYPRTHLHIAQDLKAELQKDLMDEILYGDVEEGEPKEVRWLVLLDLTMKGLGYVY